MSRFPDRDTSRTRPEPSRPLNGRQTGHRGELDRRGHQHTPARRSFQDRLQASLVDVAIHRAVASRDLVAQQFDGHRFVGRRGLDSLKNSGLVTEQTIPDSGAGHDVQVLTATPAGQKLAARVSLERGYGQGQRTWAGLGKRADLVHDLAIYRAVTAARDTLAAKGLQVRRVRLDAELRRSIMRPVEAVRARRGPDAARALRAELADRHHLPTSPEGEVLYPDAQLEYATGRDGPEAGRVNIEITTEHYRGAAIAAKAKAGFALFAANAKAGRHLANTLRGLSLGAPGHAGGTQQPRGGRGNDSLLDF